MRADENKAIVRRFIEQAFNEGNLAAIDELVASDYVIHVARTEVRGHNAVRKFVTMYRTAFPDYHCTIDDQVAEGDKVVTRWTASGTQRGELAEIPPTGKHMTLPGVAVDRIANGKLVETWLQADMLGMMQQLGVIPAPEQASA